MLPRTATKQITINCNIPNHHHGASFTSKAAEQPNLFVVTLMMENSIIHSVHELCQITVIS